MDIAYDHIQEESLPSHHERDTSAAAPSPSSSSTTDNPHQPLQQSQQQPQTLNTEFQQAFQAVSASPWGARLGGWFGEARKQGQTFYSELQKEASEAQQQASKGFEGLRGQLAQRTAGLNLNAEGAPHSGVPGEEAVPGSKKEERSQTKTREVIEEDPARPESLTADIVKEAGSLVASLRLTATSKLKDLQRAEDAADEALLKFGTNVRDFLRDAVVISAPTAADASKPKGTDAAGNEVLFETTEQGTGRKVFHTTRLDAQLHAVHTTASSFTQDPQGEQWAEWEKGFDVDKQTEAIAQDLDKFEDLRGAMEKLVPEKVEYRPFWVRYYFIRKAIDEEEKKRKEILKDAAADNEEDVAWDDDDDEDEEAEQEAKTSTPQQNTSHKASASTITLTQSAATAAEDTLKAKSPRRSTEEEAKSVADSDTSYDIVSGATSRAPGSPKDEKKDEKKEDSDDDWE
ncbi:hypothetical protein Q7P35_004706 [Cladosporium inversicolor]